MATGETAKRPTCCGQVERQGTRVPADLAAQLDKFVPGWRSLSSGELAFVIAARSLIAEAGRD